MRHLLLPLLLLVALRTNAHDPDTLRYHLRADLIQHSIALPGFGGSWKPPATGLRLGIDRSGRQGAIGTWRQRVFIGGYHHPHLHDAFLISGEVAYRFNLKYVCLGLAAGPGYMLQLPHTPVYRYRNGEYERTGQLVHRATVQIAAEVGWCHPKGIELLLRSEGMAEYPYRLKAATVLPHRLTSIAVAIPLGSGSNKTTL